MAELVLIEWEDSVQPMSQWQYLSVFQPRKPIHCVSVGFLVHDGKSVKALAPNMGDVNASETIQASGIIHIPVSCIKKISKLEEME